MPSAAKLGGCELSHSSPQTERRSPGHPPASDSLRQQFRLQPAHSLETEGNALSQVGAPSPVFGVRWTPPESRYRTFAGSAKGGNVPELAQSNIRMKLLEILLTRLKSATSLFLIDNFCPHF